MLNCRFKSNDHYLKELIEEWCEGVIQHNNQSQKGLTSSKGTNLRPQSLLLEKVAEHLQKCTTDKLTVDLRGLTKVTVWYILACFGIGALLTLFILVYGVMLAYKILHGCNNSNDAIRDVISNFAAFYTFLSFFLW